MLLALKAQICQRFEKSIHAINNSPAKLNNNFKTRNFFIEKPKNNFGVCKFRPYRSAPSGVRRGCGETLRLERRRPHLAPARLLFFLTWIVSVPVLQGVSAFAGLPEGR